ncbi:MAG: O-antigen ligase family protein [Saprospiraceae bacterium]|nr:O-antigen ligase family protein [Saprospiraceae bacterium]
MVKKQYLVYLFCGALITSLVFSKYFLSVSIISLVVLGLFTLDKTKGGWSLKTNFVEVWDQIRNRQYRPFLALTLFFFLVLFSFWQTDDNWNYFFRKVTIKLPFLVLPIAFLALPRFSKREFHNLLYFLLLLITGTGLFVCIDYAQHFAEYNELVKIGKQIPVPGDHVRFSVLVAISILVGFVLYSNKHFFSKAWESKLILGCTLFLIGFIHVLSVKTGILSLYLFSFFLLIQYMVKKKAWAVGLGSLVLMGALLIGAIRFIPSLNQKFHYTKYDLEKFFQGEGDTYNDSGRITSVKVGWELFKENPVFGVGAGNLREATNQVYSEKFSGYPPFTPINQFMYTLSSTGIFGLSLFLIAFFTPFLFKRLYTHQFLLGIFVVHIFLCLIENTLENAVGVGTFVFFLVLSLNHFLKEAD